MRKFIKNAFIIALEGIDGSGKTTQCQMLADYLNKIGVNAQPVGRRFIYSSAITLFKGTEVIIFDRYIDTVKVFFHYRKNRKIKKILRLFPPPHLVFYLELDVDLALELISVRGGKSEKYESKEELEIFKRAYKAEFNLKTENNGAYKLNASEPIEFIHKKIARIVIKRLSLRAV